MHRTDDDVGTNLNLLFRVSYCGENVCASFAHISHGAALGIETEKANSGLNFLYLEYSLPMSALTIYLKKIALAALWALTLALLVLSLGWMPLARATDLGKPLILVAKPGLPRTY